jgi:predicted RNase H-like HicB family nuclease
MQDTSSLKLTAVFEPTPEGGFTCFFEEMPDVFSQGETVTEAESNLLDALKLVLDYHRDLARQRPSSEKAVRHEFQFAPA